MKELEKLIQDEQGKLHGGFVLQSPQEIVRTYVDNKNVNCDPRITSGDSNQNCICGCGMTPPPSQPAK